MTYTVYGDEKKELSSPSFSRAATAKDGEEANVAYMG